MPGILNDQHLLVFTKCPSPGNTKTRLIPAIGAEGAARLQHAMTLHTLAQVVSPLNAADYRTEIRFDGADESAMRGLYGSQHGYVPQGEGDLGARLARAAAEAFARGGRRVVMIGTDCPDLTAPMVRSAFAALGDSDVVLGPARDGGYYLIGLGKMTPELFQNVPWSTDAVLRTTLEIARQLRAGVHLLPELEDVDRPEDLAIWRRACRPDGLGRRGSVAEK